MANKYLDLTKEQLMAFIALPIDKPLQMLNLLKFKKDLTETGLTGIQQYEVYMKAALPFFEKSKAKIVFYGEPQFTLIGPAHELEWDKILIVEYQTKDDFMQMIMTEGYPAKLRSLALDDSRLVFCLGKEE